jgi:hypothetical protein
VLDHDTTTKNDRAHTRTNDRRTTAVQQRR